MNRIQPTTLVLCLSLCATALPLLVAAPARAILTCTATAKLTKPTTNDAPATTSGSREVEVASEHTLTITGGTASQTIGGKYNCELLVDANIVGRNYFPTWTISQVGPIKLDENGEWKAVVSLSAKPNVVFGKRLFKAVTELDAEGAEASNDDDAKTLEIGLVTNTPTNPTDPRGPGTGDPNQP